MSDLPRLPCAVCSEPARWALARLSDRHVVGYCSPHCARADLDAALAPVLEANVVLSEAIDAEPEVLSDPPESVMRGGDSPAQVIEVDE